MVKGKKSIKTKSKVKAKTKIATVRRGGPLKKVIKESIMKELSQIVQQGNILGVTHQQLADKFSSEHQVNIRRQLISNMLDDVYKSIPAEDIDSTRVKIQVMFDRLFREVQKMMQTASNQRERKEAIDLLLRCMDRFTAFLEAFGIKERVADKVEVRSLNVNLDMVATSKEILASLKK